MKLNNTKKKAIEKEAEIFFHFHTEGSTWAIAEN